jgi:hypothetical protein
MSPAVSVSEPVGSDGILDCRIAGPLVRIEALPPGVWARTADLFRPFVVKQDVHDIAEPVARFRVIRRGGGDWIARQFDVNGHPVGTEDRRMQAGGRIGNLLAMLEWRAMDAALAATDQYAVVHAAALRHGVDTVFLLGRSGVGKTTLTLGLMGRGWQQFSDDVAPVDTQSLEVRAFPRCFHVDAATIVALPVRPPLEKVGGLATYLRPVTWADGAGRPSAIVVVERNPKLPTTMHPLSQAEAAGALLEATIRNQLPGSERTRVAVRLAAEARSCRALNNMSLTTSLDLIEEAVAR